MAGGEGAGYRGLYLNPPEHAIVLCVDENRRYRRWIGHSRICRCGLVCLNNEPAITSGMAHLTVRSAGYRDRRGDWKMSPRHRHRSSKIHASGGFKAPADAGEIHLVLDNYGTTRRRSRSMVLVIRDTVALHPTSAPG